MIFEDKEFIAKKLRYARKDAKLTQEELAETIGITAKQLSRIEMATYVPSLPTFLKLVKALNIDLNEFGLSYSETKNSSREDFLKMIYSFTDNELEFYYNVIKTMVEKSSLLIK